MRNRKIEKVNIFILVYDFFAGTLANYNRGNIIFCLFDVLRNYVLVRGLRGKAHGHGDALVGRKRASKKFSSCFVLVSGALTKTSGLLKTFVVPPYGMN
jgi:hypothetical protein